MESNIIVKGALVAIGALVLLVILKSCNGEVKSYASQLSEAQSLTQIEREALGIEADSPADTVSTLVSEVRNLKNHILTLEADNKSLQSDNSKLQSMEETIEKKLMNELNRGQAEQSKIDRREREAQEKRLQDMLARTDTKPDDGLNFPFSKEPNGELVGDTYWVRPLEKGESSGGLIGGLTERLGAVGEDNGIAGDRIRGGLFSLDAGERAPPIEPYFTIAKNSTLVNSTAMTSLIGRVPIGGNVADPYFFKVIVGRENLIANRHELPEVAHAIVSGEAFGDWTLSCVRGKVYSITFVFNDGTVRTVPKPEDVYDSKSKTQKIELGELSDQYGNPCVPGQKKSNAGKYLAGRIAANAAEAAAVAAAASETTQFASVGGGGLGTATVVDGSKGDFVYNATLAGAARETADWIRERQTQEFDAVYVKAGARVAIHVNEEINLDYNPVGRKVRYGQMKRSAHRVLD